MRNAILRNYLNYAKIKVVCLSVCLNDCLSVWRCSPLTLPLLLLTAPFLTTPPPSHRCPYPFSISNEEWRTNLFCWKNLWNISLKEQYALESSQEVRWHELDDLWKNKKYSPINKSYYHKGKTMSNRWNTCVNHTCTFISWIIFSWVGLKKKIPSSQFKCLQHKTSWLSLNMSQVAIRPAVVSSFSSMKRLEVFLLSPGWDASPSQGYPPALNMSEPIYTPGWREALWE